MIPNSPADALGPHAEKAKELIVDVVRTRHEYAAVAHQVAYTRSTRGYSTMWSDLLADTQEAFSKRGYDLHKLLPGGYKVPIVNLCLIYPWRVPDSADPADFAKSPTRMACFGALPPEPPLFDLDFINTSTLTAPQSGAEPGWLADLAAEMTTVNGKMPVVIVKVYSSPEQLRAITWAIGELNLETRKLSYHGEETIWQAEPAIESDAFDVESFAAGTPVEPVVEPRKQEGIGPNA